MAKSAEHVVKNGKASFYASILPDIKEAALKHGWALGLHGSLANDMDIMAMPWTEDAASVETVIMAISDCFDGCVFKDQHTKAFLQKPNGRIVYTLSIFSDWYLDINIIDRQESSSVEELKKEIQSLKQDLSEVYRIGTFMHSDYGDSKIINEISKRRQL